MDYWNPRGLSNLVVVGCTSWPEDAASDDDASTSAHIRKELPGVRADTLAAFFAVRWSEDVLIREHFFHPTAIRTVVPVFRDAHRLDRLRAEFPSSNGITFLSRVGYSTDRRQALLYAAIVPHDAFPQGGFGFYVLASHQASSWHMRKTLAWVA